MHLRLNEKSIEIPSASLEFERLWFATQQVMHLSDISYEEDGIQLADAPVQEGQYPKRDRPVLERWRSHQNFPWFQGEHGRTQWDSAPQKLSQVLKSSCLSFSWKSMCHIRQLVLQRHHLRCRIFMSSSHSPSMTIFRCTR